jgi:hypothetical protein
MREPHVEGVATHDDPEPCIGAREDAGEALGRGTCGPGIEPRNNHFWMSTLLQRAEDNMRPIENARWARSGAVGDPVHVRNLSAREPGDLRVARRDGVATGRVGKAKATSRR